MKKFVTLFLLLIALNQLFSLESMGQVTGSVIDVDQQPLPLVNIIIKQSNTGTQTDSNGKYSIAASRGDTLVFSHLGMHAVELRVKRSNEKIRIEMEADTIALEEVEVKAKVMRYAAYKSQKELLAEYKNNKNLIKTSTGILDRDLSSTAFRIIDGNDMVPGGRDFLNSLEGHVPQITVIRDCEECDYCDCVYLRNYTGSPSTALFDVDGFLTPSPPTYLTAGDIDRIAILERNAAIMRYGPQGAVGVIVINTRAQTEMDDKGIIRSYDNRGLADSLKKAVASLEPYRLPVSSYMIELSEAGTRKEAMDIYETQKAYYLNDPYFFLNVYDYFLSRWGSSRESQELFKDVKSHLPDNVPELKALAYLQQGNGMNVSALELYIQILLKKSWEGQTLRDLANAYVEAGDIKKAWMYYRQYIDIQNQLPDTQFEAYDADILITTDMMGILDLYEEPFLNNQDMEVSLNEDMRTRLVFEWNQPEAEFELQFVTPEGFYDTWEHQGGNDVAPDPEIAKGYCSKQFFLGKENLGLWQVNLDYKGNRTELPTYLKVSVYRNFGLADQSLEVNVYKLSEENEKVQLLTLQQR